MPDFKNGTIVEITPGGLLLMWPDSLYRYPGMLERNRFEVCGRQEKMILVKMAGIDDSQIFSICPYSLRQVTVPDAPMITPGFGVKFATL